VRGRSLLTGAHWAGVVPDGVVDVVADIDVSTIDEVWPALAADERVLFVLGFEASLGQPPTTPADRRAWRVRLVAPAERDNELPRAPATLALSTTEAAQRAHLERVARCRELLLDGVLYQANLAHAVDVAVVDDAAARAWFLAQPAHALGCSAYVDVDGFGALVSLSPERFLAADLRARVVRTHPIKGTVPRSASTSTLLSSTKDEAEHVMIVDLLRNDLARVCRPGTVTVESLMHLLSTPSVHHLESTIAGALLPDVGVAELLRACAPGGSITGAPKSSAVEVIQRLEAGPRGPYTGVLGVVDGAGALMSALLIRTWVRRDGAPGVLHVGGGVVVDSDPEREWQETLHKARAFGDVVVRPLRV
jgi:anthranilate/para-aminobenzoate synthase component I